MGKTRKDRRDKFDFYDEGRRDKRYSHRRNSKQNWKQYENTTSDEVLGDYDYEDDMVEDDS